MAASSCSITGLRRSQRRAYASEGPVEVLLVMLDSDGDARYAALLEHSYSYLTPVQRETGRLVNTGTAFDGLLTMKVEGSLSCFCVAFAGTYAYALVDKLIAALPDMPGPARHAAPPHSLQHARARGARRKGGWSRMR